MFRFFKSYILGKTRCSRRKPADKLEALMNKIQGVSNEVHKEKDLMIKYEALMASNETLRCDSAAMGKDLVDLNLQIGVLRKGRSHLLTFDHLDGLKAENDLLQKNLDDANEEIDSKKHFKYQLLNLEVSESTSQVKPLSDKNTEVQNPNDDLGQKVHENQDRINNLNVKNVTVDDDSLEHMKTVQENQAQQARR